MSENSERKQEEASTLNIHQRINAVQREATYVRQERKQGMQYAITSHDAVVAKLRPLMVEQGIVMEVDVEHFEQSGSRTSAYVAVSFVNMNKPEERFTVHGFGYGEDKQDKGPGKAVSYAFKYILLKTFCLETGEGDDPDFHQGPESDHVPALEPEEDSGPMGATSERNGLYSQLGLHKGKVEARYGKDKTTTMLTESKMELQIPEDLKKATLDQLETLEEHMAKMVAMMPEETT